MAQDPSGGRGSTSGSKDTLDNFQKKYQASYFPLFLFSYQVIFAMWLPAVMIGPPHYGKELGQKNLCMYELCYQKEKAQLVVATLT